MVFGDRDMSENYKIKSIRNYCQNHWLMLLIVLQPVLDILAREQVFIEYMYAFSEGELASVIIRPTDVAKCIETLNRCKCRLVSFRSE